MGGRFATEPWPIGVAFCSGGWRCYVFGMAQDPRTRTRNFLGLDPLKGSNGPPERSAYARFTSPGPDTTSSQLVFGAIFYAVLSVFSVALLLGSSGLFGKIFFGIVGLLGLAFIAQRVILLANRKDD